MVHVDYNGIAGEYDRRYELYDYPGIRSTVLDAIEPGARQRVLEVGCGTGRWLAELVSVGCEVSGADPSVEMLRRASSRVSCDLRQASAEALQWGDAFFDVVFYINALHHLTAPELALHEAFRVLRPGGKILSIGLDPHEKCGRWYVYEFFPETLRADLARFPSRASRAQWIEAAGFRDVVVDTAERIQLSMSFEEALRSGVLERSFTSQLTALSPADYLAGRQRLRETAERNSSFRLEVDLELYATHALKPR